MQEAKRKKPAKIQNKTSDIRQKANGQQNQKEDLTVAISKQWGSHNQRK